MKSYQPSQSSRGSRRSSKHRTENGGRSSERRSTNGSKKNPPTLWQKITSFFTRSSDTPAPAKRSVPTGSGRSPETDSSAKPKNTPPPRTARKPEAVEVTSPRLYVGNLSFDATESDLTELFKGVGQVVSVEVVSHRQTQRSKGFAFVQMQTVEEAKRAVEELHDKEFMNRKLVVSGAKNIDQQDGRSEPRFAA